MKYPFACVQDTLLLYAAGVSPSALRPGYSTSMAIFVCPTGNRAKMLPAILKRRGAFDILTEWRRRLTWSIELELEYDEIEMG